MMSVVYAFFILKSLIKHSTTFMRFRLTVSDRIA